MLLLCLRQLGNFDLNAFVSVKDDFGVFDTIEMVCLSRVVFINVTDVFTAAPNGVGRRRGHDQRRPLACRLIRGLDVGRINSCRKSEAIADGSFYGQKPIKDTIPKDFLEIIPFAQTPSSLIRTGGKVRRPELFKCRPVLEYQVYVVPKQ